MAVSGSVSTTKYDGRYYTLSWTAEQSVAKNQSTIKWTLKAVGGSSSWYAERDLEVTIDGATVYSKTDRVSRYTGTVKTGSTTLTHNSSGDKSFTVEVEAAVYTSSINCTGSKSFTLNNIPRKATITSAPNFNDEANPRVTYSNLAGNSVTTLQVGIYSADAKTAYAAYRDVSKTGGSYTFNLTQAERDNLRAASANSNTLTVRFYIKTVIGGATFTHYVAKTLTIINATPRLTVTVADGNSKTSTLTGDANKLVKYYSVVTANAGYAALKKAGIKSYKVTNGGKTGTTIPYTFNKIESGVFEFSVTDTRGNTVTEKITKTLVEYIKLTCGLGVSMPTADGNVSLTIKGNYFNNTFGAYDNTLTVQYRYRANDGEYSSWVTVTPTLSGNSYTAEVDLSGLDYLNSYTFEARAADAINTSYISSDTKTVKTIPTFDWGKDDFNFNVPVTLSRNKPLQGVAADGSNKNLIYLTSGDSLQVGGGAYPPDNIYISTKDNAGAVSINGRRYGENKILWSGAYYMSENQVANLTEAISEQPNGIILVFSRYNTAGSEVLDQHFSYHIFPKIMLSYVGAGGSVFNMRTSTESYAASKYLYFTDTSIKGHANNNDSGTGNNGITYTNNAFVLRYVIGF